ncbi:hypothetical protein SISNIDRAFT_548455 [Sistotremastrum niveocremeum HHB9708]|uniref:Rab-GAP TBC domain-containing protein n=1 Tax=Sistotremastrum niveocremeum HHB9708 TaxID=1314777 RepID=A0A164X3K9_9AGAM|nr:hypothetical protein SISNIDRAFT_548455 [Sistotremastrum niveocremeum HHB9708]
MNMSLLPLSASALEAMGKNDWERLREISLLPGGFGEARAEIWPFLLQVSKQGSEGGDEMSPAKEEVDEPHHDERQVSLDTDRSFVIYPEEETLGQKQALQSHLQSLIVQTLRRRPKLHYFQGYHDIVSVLMLSLPDQVQVECVEMMSLHRLRDSMGKGLEPMVGLLRILRNLLRVADPEYAKLLEKDSPLPYFALSNLLTLFSHDVPTLPLIQHIFDWILCRPPIAVVYLTAQLLLERKAEIVKFVEEDDDGMLYAVLNALPPLQDIPPQPSPDPTPSESEQNMNMDARSSSIGSMEDISSSQSLSIPSPPEPESSDEPGPSEEEKEESVAVPESTISFPPPSPEPESDSEQEQKPEPEPEQDQVLVDRHQPTSQSMASPSPVLSSPILPSSPQSPTSDPSSPTPSPSPSPSLLPSRSHSNPDPTSSSKLPTPPINLPTLLKNTDTLYLTHPPSSPLLSIPTILGPNSVIRTYSENKEDMPTEDEAENMMDDPGRIVWAYIPSPVPSDEEDEEDVGKGGEKEGRREKLRKWKEERSKGGGRRVIIPGGLEVDRNQLVLAGAAAVVVVGVFIAVYSAPNDAGKWRKAGRWMKGKILDWEQFFV